MRQDQGGGGMDHGVEMNELVEEDSFHSHQNDDGDDDEEDEEEYDEESGFNVTAMVPSSTSLGIATPAPVDVICGRGKMTSSHPGNRRFRELVLEKKEAYQRARRRDEKTQITFELVLTLREGGSKFLLFDTKTGLWYDVGDEYAREKVSHSLRSRPNEHRRTKPKPPRKSSLKKNPHSPAIDKIVSQLLNEQQSLLKTMIAAETTRAATEAATAGSVRSAMEGELL